MAKSAAQKGGRIKSLRIVDPYSKESLNNKSLSPDPGTSKYSKKCSAVENFQIIVPKSKGHFTHKTESP
jgi:hypothetical protein